MKYCTFLFIVITSCKSLTVSDKKTNDRSTVSENKGDVFVANKLLYFDSLLNSSRIDVKYHTSLGTRIEENTLYMEELTKIHSTGIANHYTRKNISQETYFAWVRWYLQNRGRLLWDDKKQNAYIKL